MILEAIVSDSSFIDIGCASGYLIEKLHDWLSNTGIKIQFYGLDISSALLEFAKQRLPQWKNNLFYGNALYYQPHFSFNYVCVRELSYVPRDKRKIFFQHLYDHYVIKNGRLIFGPSTEEKNKPGIENDLKEWGFMPSGYCIKSHQLYWFDKKR